MSEALWLIWPNILGIIGGITLTKLCLWLLDVGERRAIERIVNRRDEE